MAKVSPRYLRPTHLAPLIALLERAHREELRVVVSLPPRHMKTELILHAYGWWLKEDPTLSLAYVSHGAEMARTKSRRARDLAMLAGVELVGRAANEWTTPQGGGLFATGIGGPLTGRGAQVLVVDDPIRNPTDAASPSLRRKQWEWLEQVAETRIEPGGSLLIVMTRWNDDDLAGRALRDPTLGFTPVVLPALSEDVEDPTDPNFERALWPERWPKASLVRKRARVGAYAWAALYQGRPQPRGGSIFTQDAFTYTELPREGVRFSIGLDFAYSPKSASDWSVAIVMAAAKLDDDDDETFFIVEVVRRQVRAPAWAGAVEALKEQYPSASLRAYIGGGGETGVADLFNGDPYYLGIDARPTSGAKKIVRAEPLAAAWNARRVRIPKAAPWVGDLLLELFAFTGVGDANDDQVDAGAAAFDILAEGEATWDDLEPLRRHSARRM